MIAGAGVMAVPDAVLLFAVGRAHARIHVKHDAFRRASESRRLCRNSVRHLANAGLMALATFNIPSCLEPPSAALARMKIDWCSAAKKRTPSALTLGAS